MKFIAASFILFGLLGCTSDDRKPVTTTPAEKSKTDNAPAGAPAAAGASVDIPAYLELGGSEFQKAGNTLTGKGSLVVQNPRTEADAHFDLNFTLKKGTSLSLVTHANAQLAQGVEILFVRFQAGDLAIILKVGNERVELTPTFRETLPETEDVQVGIDVHQHGHIIFWFQDKKTEFGFKTPVSGRFWGIKLNSGILLKAQAGKARLTHN